MTTSRHRPLFVVLLLGVLPAIIHGAPKFRASGGTGGLDQIGAIAGAAALSYLALSATLSLRHPTMARLTQGLAPLYRLHHFAGLLAIGLVITHVGLLALASYRSSPEAAAYLFRFHEQPPALLLGWLSISLLSIVALSASILDRSCRFWRALHLLSLPAIVFALYHFHSLGSSRNFGSGLLYAISVLGLAAALVRAFKYAFSYRYRVRFVEQFGDDTVAITLDPEGRPLECEEGQFVFAAFHTGSGYIGCNEFHPFNVTSLGSDRSLELIVKARGDCSCALQHVVPGVRAHIEGPFGGFRADSAPQLWIGGGIGIASFLPLLERMQGTGQPIDIYYLVRSEEKHVLSTRLETARKEAPEVVVHLLSIDEDAQKFVAHLRSETPDFGSRSFILSGPPQMVLSVEASLSSLGIPDSRMQHESFGMS